jgi:hypothetical protein
MTKLPTRVTGARAPRKPAAVTRHSGVRRDGFPAGQKAGGFGLSSTALRRMAAAGLASAAAAAVALFYKKSATDEAGVEPEATSRNAPGTRSKRTRTAAATRLDEAPGAPVRRRKKRSDAGVKRGSRTKAAATQSPTSEEPLVKTENTVTTASALTAGSLPSDQSADRSEALAEAHPS